MFLSVDGVVGPWSAWSTCTVSCDGGTQTRDRNCTYTPPTAPHGTLCSDPLSDDQDCNTDACAGKSDLDFGLDLSIIMYSKSTVKKTKSSH